MTQDMLFAPPESLAIPVAGDSRQFPLRRIFCVGRNYAAHAAEMGNEVDREAPFYFTKSAHALCLSGATIPYPPGTQDCHYEMEFVVAIGAPAFRVTKTEAMQAVWGYGCGIDLTRRDLQGAAKDKRRPWDLGKDFENSALMAALTPADAFGEIGQQRITLRRDDEIVQDASLGDMVWSVPELIAHLSGYYHLLPGDLIYTGTPAGVGPVQPGSVLVGEIEGLEPVRVTIGEAE
ncbi:fumarylacetoacetate hydrolase family protein [Roseovarius sp.]|jgi:fumarylpyruvate hydrolase